MDKTTSPAVVTSDKAMENYQNIKSQHADIVKGMAMQSTRLQAQSQARDQQKATEKQNQMTMANDMKKAELVANTDLQKTSMDMNMRQAELDVKKAALAQP